MTVKFLLAALVAGILAGMAMSAAQAVKVVPLILHSEQYEKAPAHHHGESGEEAGAAAHDHGQAASQNRSDMATGDLGGDNEGVRLFGIGRFGGTLMANVVAGAGFALVLAAIVLISGKTITFANAFGWGLCAWFAVQFLPAMGLAPELPGMPAADLGARQYWWAGTVVASAAGLWAVAFLKPWTLRLGGLVLLAIPHIVGAPQPANIASDVPATLASEYAVAALATTLFFWLVLSYLLAWTNGRFGVAEQ
jgi:cobalt transporter subunit CbtA